MTFDLPEDNLTITFQFKKENDVSHQIRNQPHGRKELI